MSLYDVSFYFFKKGVYTNKMICVVLITGDYYGENY